MSLYDAVVPTFTQLLRSTSGLIGKAQAFATEHGLPESDLLASRLADDMRPLAFQFQATLAHSAGAIANAFTGQAAPDRSDPSVTLNELAERYASALDAIEGVSRDALDLMRDRPVTFAVGERQLHFTAETYLLSFAQPNFFFHATTAYAILRHRGVPIGKRDYLGQMRLAS